MTTLDDESLQGYRAECGKQLAIMEKEILALELGEVPAGEDLMRATHAMAESAGPAGLDGVADLARGIERALARFRLQRAVPTPAQVTILLRAVDGLRGLLDSPEAKSRAAISAVLGAIAEGATAASLRMLLVEDDFTSRLLLQTFLSRYGECHIAVNGREAVEAVRTALDRGQIYHLICMDFLMPEMDGGEAVRQIRALEEARGILSTDGAKIFMTTAVDDLREVKRCFQHLCDAYLVKPIDLRLLHAQLNSHNLVK
jgi:two-component system chemotaxis response regulator CheY